MPEEQQSKPEKEERIDLKIGVPVSVGMGLSERLFGSPEEAVPAPDFSPQGQGGPPPGQSEGGLQFGKDNGQGGQGDPEEEEMMAAVMERMGGGEIPAGVNPQEVMAMVSQGAGQIKQLRANAEQQKQTATTPPGQPGGTVPSPGGLPTQEEALAQQREAPVEVTSKKEFREGEEAGKAPEWWKKLIYQFSGGIAGESEAGFQRKLDRAYAEHVAPQLEARAEQERQRTITERFAPETEDELVEWTFGNQTVKLARKDTKSILGLVEKAWDRENAENEKVNLRTLFPDDPNAPDMILSKELALQYGEFYIDQKNAGLGTGRDLLKVKNPKLWKELEDHEQAQAKELIQARAAAEEKIAKKQVSPSSLETARQRDVLGSFGEYGRDTSPDLQNYIRGVGTYKTSQLDDEQYKNYRENARILQHSQDKQSINRDWAKEEIKKKGFYFMNGKRYAGNYSTVRKNIMRDIRKEGGGTAERNQANHWLKYHYEEDYRFDGPEPPLPYEERVEPINVEKIKEMQVAKFLGSSPSAAEISSGGTVSGTALEQKRTQIEGATKDPKELDPLGPKQKPASLITRWARENEKTFEEGVAQAKREGFTVVMGR